MFHTLGDVLYLSSVAVHVEGQVGFRLIFTYRLMQYMRR